MSGPPTALSQRLGRAVAASRFLMRPRARAFRNVLLQFFLEMSVTLPQRQTMRSLFLRTLSVENAYIPQSRHGMQIRMSRMEPFFCRTPEQYVAQCMRAISKQI